MLVLVFSDSHGNTRPMAEAVRRHQPGQVIHLGDCWQDAQRLQQDFPGLALCQVNGNCDPFPAGVWEKTVSLGGVRAFLCHGHTRRVKSGHGAAAEAARQAGADLLLFGHTHRRLLLQEGGLCVMNPGSVGEGWNFGSYGLIRVERPGEIRCEIVNSEGTARLCAASWALGKQGG